MTAPIRLIPLVCCQCQAAIPAQVDEVAWVCPQCGQGLLLSEKQGTEALNVHYSAALQPGQKGRPFWVVSGRVEQLQRQIFGSSDQSAQAGQFWETAHTFFIPAFDCSLDQCIELGTRLIQSPPALQAGSPAEFVPITTHPADLKSYAGFIVMGIEAARKDRLKHVDFSLQLEQPELWILP